MRVFYAIHRVGHAVARDARDAPTSIRGVATLFSMST